MRLGSVKSRYIQAFQHALQEGVKCNLAEFMQSQYDWLREILPYPTWMKFSNGRLSHDLSPTTLSRHLDTYLLLVCGSQVVEAGSIWSEAHTTWRCCDRGWKLCRPENVKKEAISWVGFMIFSERWWVFPRCLLLTWPLGLHTFPDCQNSCP